MCPGLGSEMARMPSIINREGPAQTFARSFSDDFTRSWEETLQGQDMSSEAMQALGCSLIEKLYVQSGYWRNHLFKEIFKQRFTSLAVNLTCALAGLDVLARHVAYPAMAAAAGRSRIITGYLGLTIASAQLFFNVSLYTAVCGLCILLYLRLNSVLLDNRQQGVLQPVNADDDPDAAQRKSEAIGTQLVAVLDLPSMTLNGWLTHPLQTISTCCLVFGTLATLLSFIFPTLWQLFFWSGAIFVVYFLASVCTIVVVRPDPDPTKDPEA